MRLGLDGRILAHSYSGIGCYLIRLLDLTPFPQSNTQIDPGDYKATLSISKETP